MISISTNFAAFLLGSYIMIHDDTHFSTWDQVNFLDVTMDLNTGKFWPFRKDDNKLLYINKESNHPPSITKQLPAMIQDRVSSLSFDKDEFMKNKEPYEKALESSGF